MKTLLTIFLLLAAEFVFAGTDIKGMRSWSAPDSTRLVFDISGPVTHKVFTLRNPERVVLDIKTSSLRADSLALKKNRFVTSIRTGVRNGTDLRVVLDLNEKVAINSFQLKPNGDYGYRLVIDLNEVAPPPATAPATTAIAAVTPKSDAVVTDVPKKSGGTAAKTVKVAATTPQPITKSKPAVTANWSLIEYSTWPNTARDSVVWLTIS